MSYVNAGARLDRLPTAKFHYRVLILIGLGVFLDLFDVYLAGGVLGSLVKEGWSNVQLNAVFISATFIGLTIGALSAGFVGDLLGRRFAYQINLLIFGLASFGAAFSPNMVWLIIFRCIMGLGLGAEIVIGYASFSEFVPARVRGRWISTMSLIGNTALLFSSLVGYIVIPNLGWRWMFIIVGVGAMIVWYMRKVLPESPRWLESKGRNEEAEEILSSIEKEIEKEKDVPLTPVTGTQTVEPAKKGSFADLFKGELLKRSILAILLLIGLNTISYTFINWLPTIFVKQGIDISKSIGYTTVMMIGGPVGAFLGIILLDRFGRKSTSVVMLFLGGIVGYLYANQTSPEMLMILGFCFTSILFMMNCVGFAVYVPELFPTEIRLRGTGTANGIGRLATVFSPYGVAWLLTAYGANTVFLTNSAIFFTLAIIMAILGIETKKKTLEEISSGKN